MTKKLARSVLISADFAACIDESVESLGYHPMKGVKELQEIFTPKEI